MVIVSVVFSTGEYVAGDIDVTDATVDDIVAVLVESLLELMVTVRVSVAPDEAVAKAAV